MALDTISEERLALVYPELATRFRRAADKLEQAGLIIRVTQGVRTLDEQDHLFSLGRTMPSHVGCRHPGDVQPRPVGSCKLHPFGATVTNARGWQSNHCLGMALDYVPDDPKVPGFQADWKDQYLYDQVIAAMEAEGLRSGKSWHDQPHVEFTGKWGPSPPLIARELLATGGIPAVWAAAFPQPAPEETPSPTPAT